MDKEETIEGVNCLLVPDTGALYFETADSGGAEYLRWRPRGDNSAIAQWSSPVDSAARVAATILENAAPTEGQVGIVQYKGDPTPRKLPARAVLDIVRSRPNPHFMMIDAEGISVNWSGPDEFEDADKYYGLGETEIVYNFDAHAAFRAILKASAAGILEQRASRIATRIRRSLPAQA